MNLVLFTHPAFLGSVSQPHFARMLADAYRQRGHRVELRQPRARLRRLAPARIAKWAGYADQYLLFPAEIRRGLAADPPQTLYVFCDQALGPWMPGVVHRPHVVHCHDLLALRSALGLVDENPTAWSGRVYQRYIRNGFRAARHFISVSERSRADLQAYGGVAPLTSEVVYNGLNHPYQRQPAALARATLGGAGLDVPRGGFLLHVGGGQWYKNSAGVLALYAAFAERRAAERQDIPPLWLLSPAPGLAAKRQIEALPSGAAVHYLPRLDAIVIEALYSSALALLFPSLAEGFGWPIAEALACGCPVLTTGEAPMTEVGGAHAHYLPRLPSAQALPAWAAHGATALAALLDRSEAERESAARAGIAWARRFDADQAIDQYLRVYETVLQRWPA